MHNTLKVYLNALLFLYDQVGCRYGYQDLESYYRALNGDRVIDSFKADQQQRVEYRGYYK